MPQILEIAGKKIARGERLKINLEIPALFDNAQMSIPLEVIRGKKPGPTLFVCAAIHGDEVNGVEALHRLLASSLLKSINGTLIVAPIVNIYGFNNKSRYLPDRRDLNRCFPGSPEGSLGSRLAHIIMSKIIVHCTHVIDIHTGAVNRTNFPQVRASFAGERGELIKDLAMSFGAPVVVNSNLRDGSFREAVRNQGKPILLFEGGEALRFEEGTIRLVVRGVISVMRNIGMLKGKGKPTERCIFAHKTVWVRAPKSGIFKMNKALGEVVKEGEVIAKITDPFGEIIDQIITPYDGIIIGSNLLPMVMAGEGLCNLGLFDDIDIIDDILENYEMTYV